jgi:hypothetical protein
VLYWAACLAAALILLSLPSLKSETQSWKDFLLHSDISYFVGFAVLIWLVGRACRYVLSGR